MISNKRKYSTRLQDNTIGMSSTYKRHRINRDLYQDKINHIKELEKDYMEKLKK